jgi:hypothetical protein
MKPNSGQLYATLIGIGLSTMLLITSFSCRAGERERKVAVQPSDLPAAITEAVKEAFPNGQIVAVQKEVEGENPGQYDVEIRSGEKQYEVEISPEGKVIESKEVTAAAETAEAEDGIKWTQSFGEQSCTFSSTGANRFFILEPGYQLVLQSRQEKVAITVLGETRKIGAVETRIVEEREEENGKLKEVSRNFYAICKEHGDVFYFGEEVDDYKDGKIVGHSGAWRADQKNSKAGIMMPGTVLLGARHYQEIAPNAMDRAEIVRDDVTMTTPAGTFKNCLKVEETTALDPGEKCYKTYAPGVGLIQDEDLVLTGYSKRGP